MLSATQRLDFLRDNRSLSILGEASLRELAQGCTEFHFDPGAVIVNEGEIGDRAFLIIDGMAEVSAAGPEGDILLSTLSPGELFGELALLSESGLRSATVTATRPLRLIGISGAEFRRLVADDPPARAQFDSAAQLMLTIKFLKLAASPFSTLPPDQFQKLAARLKPISIPAHTAIVKQGDEGDSCFIVRNGQVEVILETEDGTQRPMTTLGPGALFGETALLTEATRNTTVRTIEPSDLLVLQRSDLIDVMGKESDVGIRLRELIQMRARPCQTPGIVAVHNTSLSGEITTILKDPGRSVYYRLSPQGWFVWQRLDGRHNLKDLTLDYLREFKAFAPQAIIEIVSGLTRMGFVQRSAFRSDVAETADRPARCHRFLNAARDILEFQVMFRNVDRSVERLYQAGVHWLYTRPAQAAMAMISLAGVVAFILDSGRTGDTLRDVGPKLLLFLIPAQIFSLLVHEAGHAFTTKSAGREVIGIGIGWYWFGPVAFVDTTDTWLATRRERIAVSFAGPYTNLILGSIAALIAYALSDAVAQAALWQFAFACYTMVIINLNPLLEYDGYYILTDLLDRPNLRSQALAWLGNGLIPALGNRRALREHSLDIFFGIGSILYVISMAAITLILYRLFLEKWLTQLIPAWSASGLAWVLAAAVVILSGMRIIGDLRNSQSPV